MLSIYKSLSILMPILEINFYICAGNIAAQLNKLKFMVEIDFNDLCVFEQLLNEKCECLSKGLKMIESSSNVHLIESFRSDLFFYSSLYDDVVAKLLNLGFKK